MKRVYTSVAVHESASGFTVTLDAAPVRTPGKRALRAPNRPLADALAAEWEAQGEVIRPADMPIMSLLATSIDRVAPARAAVIDAIAAYGEADLICYRAEEPPDLVQRQEEAWGPLVAWSAEVLGADLHCASGIMPVSQAPQALAAMRAAVAQVASEDGAGDAAGDAALTVLHEMTVACGSVVIGLAILKDHLGALEGLAVSRLDEDYQIEKWGEDSEAAARRVALEGDVAAAARFLHLCRSRA